MLDQRPIPRYMMGFPTEVQETILRTVENQLEEFAKEIMPQVVAETITSKELDQLRQICKDEKVNYLSYQPRLALYLMALNSDTSN